VVDANKIIEARKRYDALRLEVQTYAQSPTGQLVGCSAACLCCPDSECIAGNALRAVDDILWECDYSSETDWECNDEQDEYDEQEEHET
jgi:hypothetical protein